MCNTKILTLIMLKFLTFNENFKTYWCTIILREPENSKHYDKQKVNPI